MRFEALTETRKHVGMTPLIDVVFLLLLFFMLASTFDKYAEIDLKVAGAGAANPSSERPVFVRVHVGGRVDVNAVATEVNELSEVLARLVAEGRRAVVVQLRRGVVTQEMVNVLERIRTSGIGTIVLSRQ